MSKQKLTGKVLVVQLASDQLRIIKTTMGAAEPPVMASQTARLPQGAVVDGVIHQYEAVRDALQLALEDPELRRIRRVVFVLCTTQVISEDISIPSVPTNRLAKMLESNMDMYFPVDTQNYHLAWQVTQKKNQKGEMSIQLWAVSTAIVIPYYDLANSLGLSVVAIDYCGHALASAVNASFAMAEDKSQKAAPKKVKAFAGMRKNERPAEEEFAAPAEEENAPAPETSLYLLAEEEHLLMLFIQEGHVQLQRMSLCGPNVEAELSEVAMALDYYDSMHLGRYSSVRCILCGALARDAHFVDAARDTLDVPLQVLPSLSGPQWILCQGAARTQLDFGVPTLNKPSGAKQINNAWQYGLVLVGGAALALSLVTTFGSKAVWSTTLNGLKSTEQTLQIQAAQNRGYADNYYAYKSAYDAYSSDWDLLHNSLRTYNDNLVLMIKELEGVLPKKTSVTGVQIADTGLSVSLASETKEEAAYTIIALRGLQYASLDGISNLVNPSFNMANAGSPRNVRYEAAPTVGSGPYDQLLGILLEANKNNTSNAEMMDMLQNAVDSGLITEDMVKDYLGSNGNATTDQLLGNLISGGSLSKEDMVETLFSLKPEEFNALEDAYAAVPEFDKTLDELRKTATLKQRQNAMETMLNKDPIGMYRFFNLFKVDMNRHYTKSVLYESGIYADLWAHEDKSDFLDVLEGDMSGAQDLVPVMVDILIKNEDTVTASEELMREDQRLLDRYTYYLATEMGLIKEDDLPSLDPDDIIDSIIGGNKPDLGDDDKNEDLDDALDSIIPGISDILKPGKGDKDDKDDQNDILNDLLNDYLNGGGQSGSTGKPNDSLDDLLNQFLGGGGTGSVAPQQPVDDRYHYTVTLGYKDALIQAERVRKGLDASLKIAELEVNA